MEKAAFICMKCNHMMITEVEDKDELQKIKHDRCGKTGNYLPSQVKKAIKDYKNIWEGSRYVNN